MCWLLYKDMGCRNYAGYIYIIHYFFWERQLRHGIEREAQWLSLQNILEILFGERVLSTVTVRGSFRSQSTVNGGQHYTFLESTRDDSGLLFLLFSRFQHTLNNLKHTFQQIWFNHVIDLVSKHTRKFLYSCSAKKQILGKFQLLTKFMGSFSNKGWYIPVTFQGQGALLGLVVWIAWLRRPGWNDSWCTSRQHQSQFVTLTLINNNIIHQYQNTVFIQKCLHKLFERLYSMFEVHQRLRECNKDACTDYFWLYNIFIENPDDSFNSTVRILYQIWNPAISMLKAYALMSNRGRSQNF